MAYVKFSGESKFNPQPKGEKPKKTFGGIKQVSEKRKLENEIYKIESKKFLSNKRCAVYPYLKATEVHHKKGRIGKLFLDQEYWLPVSRKGHKKIEENPEWAKENGFSLNRI